MKMILTAVAMVMLMAGSALAIDANGAGEPEHAAAGTERTTAFTYASGHALPTWFLIFNGSGDEIELKFTYDGDVQGTATVVPGNIMLPAATPSRSGSSWIYEIYTACSTDDVHIYPVFK